MPSEKSMRMRKPESVQASGGCRSSPARRSTAGSGSGGGLCPICHVAHRNLFRHARHHHLDHYWTAAEAAAVGGQACSTCGALVHIAANALNQHLLHSHRYIAVPAANSEPRAGTAQAPIDLVDDDDCCSPPVIPSTISVTVVLASSLCVRVSVRRQHTVRLLLAIVEDQEGVTLDCRSFHILFNGERVAANERLSKIGVEDGDLISLMPSSFVPFLTST